MNDTAGYGLPDDIGNFPFDVIEMTGAESADLLHRIGTSDLSGLAPGEIWRTLLLTEKGRIVDAVWVLHTGRSLLLLTSGGRGEEVMRWLDRSIIMEDITLADRTSSRTVDVSFRDPQRPGGVTAMYFMQPASFIVREQRRERPAECGPLFEEWRIHAGIPQAGHELTDDYNPLELNLWDWISFTKGCYPGQEVIARLETYNKVQRAIYRFRSGGPVRAGESLRDDTGREAGRITSAIEDGEGFIGLAVVRSKDPFQPLETVTGSGTKLTLEPLATRETYGRTAPQHRQ